MRTAADQPTYVEASWHMRHAAILLTALLLAGFNNTPATQSTNAIAAEFRELVRQGEVVGVQGAAGTVDRVFFEQAFGRTRPGGGTTVDTQTQFCIGSCSKPFAAVCLLKLVSEGRLNLDAPIDGWLPAFGRLPIAGDGIATRAPTVRELLSHRAGIYSQKERMTRAQREAIRDYSHTLNEAVEIIGKQPLLAAPGQRYAYSGAGYCVAGRVAELVTGSGFEALLQAQLGQPLGLTRTTYFPDPKEPNLALGGVPEGGRVVVNREAPAAGGSNLRLALVGGGIHSTAGETLRFARLVLSGGWLGKQRLLPEAAWAELTRRQHADQDYGLDFRLVFATDGRTVERMEHGGSLASAKSLLVVDLKRATAGVIHWTQPTPESDPTRKHLEALMEHLLAATSSLRGL
jgi:CubicO group peptidase (beta-lactamase class C family)